MKSLLNERTPEFKVIKNRRWMTDKSTAENITNEVIYINRSERAK